MASTQPRIGVPCGIRTKDVPRGVPRLEVPQNYTDAIIAAGGLPVLLVPRDDNGNADEYAEIIDGLLLTGGPDINPQRYGQDEVHPEVQNNMCPPLRENFEFAGAEAMRKRGKPVLGICLGHQVMNVALGGTLIQHLPDRLPADHPGHSSPDLQAQMKHHPVEILPNTRLAQLIQPGATEVNTSHHQAVDKIAPGLRLAAKALDGTIEALESEEGDQFLSTQWHPEYKIDDPMHLGLFQDLIARAKRHAR